MACGPDTRASGLRPISKTLKCAFRLCSLRGHAVHLAGCAGSGWAAWGRPLLTCLGPETCCRTSVGVNAWRKCLFIMCPSDPSSNIPGMPPHSHI
eukprot:831227-Amphidinium_carterae.1